MIKKLIKARNLFTIFLLLLIFLNLSLISISYTRITTSISENFIWHKTWGDLWDDHGDDIAIDTLDNIYVVGYTTTVLGDKDIVLLKFDLDGILQWERIWGGSGDIDYILGLFVDSSNNIYATGETNSYGAGNRDIVLLKYEAVDNDSYMWILSGIIIAIVCVIGGVGIFVSVANYKKKMDAIDSKKVRVFIDDPKAKRIPKSLLNQRVSPEYTRRLETINYCSNCGNKREINENFWI